LVAAQVQNFGPTHATATANFVAASTVVVGNESDESTSKFSDFGDSGSSVEWTEESSDEDLDTLRLWMWLRRRLLRVLRMLKFCLVRVLGVGSEGRWRSVE
jgi:hypothetical protein